MFLKPSFVNPHQVHIIRSIKLGKMRQAKHVAHKDVHTENIKENDHFGDPGTDRYPSA
jgi:hypothetical protein